MKTSHNLLIIGLTGGIGSGKTTVSNLFEKLGAAIIDTDLIAHELVNKDPGTLDEIVNTFGARILTQAGTLNRKKLAAIIFGNTDKKRQLEKILHPRIRTEVTRRIQILRSANSIPRYVIVVIPLLFETGFADITDQIIVVISDKKTRVDRILQRDNRSMQEIELIIGSQVTDKQRIMGADDIIENNNDFKTLELQVLQLHKKYTA